MTTFRSKTILSWCLYDWANSAFAMTVLAGFFPIFFKTFWCSEAEATISTGRLSIGNFSAGLIIAILSPVLGALADAGKAKKKFLLFFAVIGMLATALFFIVEQGHWWMALMVFIGANIGFSCANLFYDSMLVDVAKPEQMDIVSSMGFSLGYLGGGLLFFVNMLMVAKPSFFGLADKAQAVRVSFLTVSGWWLLFSIPFFVFVREKTYQNTIGAAGIIRESIKRLSVTIKHIRGNRLILFFLIAYWLYIDGVHTFIRMAVDFGMAIELSPTMLMVALLVVQFVAFPSSFLFGVLANRFGAGRLILVGIGIYIMVCGIGAFLLQTSLHFILLAALIGVAQGGIQALSRSYFGKLVPPESSAEYFGFYNVFSKFAIILGPVLVGGVAVFSRKAGLHSHAASRLGMSSVVILFIAGGIMLIVAERVRKKD